MRKKIILFLLFLICSYYAASGIRFILSKVEKRNENLMIENNDSLNIVPELEVEH